MEATPKGELPHLETFCKAAELLSFTSAADALCLTQAAVSQRIRALEQDIGVPVFTRNAGRVALTTAGKRLYQYAQEILSLHQKARQALGETARELSGELHLAASTVPAEHLLPSYLQAFQKSHPRVHVVARVADSAAVLPAVEHGDAELGLVGRRGPLAWAESKPFARDRLLLVAPGGHRWRQQRSIALEELAQEPLVLREPGSGSRACLEEALGTLGWGLQDLRVVLELGSNEAIKEAVLRGAGVAWLSAFAVKQELHSGRLHHVRVAGLDVCRDLYVVTDRRRVLPAAARAFLELVEGSPFRTATLTPSRS